MFGLESWKPIVTALVLPPVPLILLILIGARLILPRRGLGFFLVFLGVTLLWLGSCQGTGRWMQNFLLKPPIALRQDEIDRLKQQVASEGKNPQTAIVVLGGGRVPRAPEYAMSDLSAASAERLRYAIWLSRQTNLPIAFSGGIGWAQLDDAQAEAEIASRVAQQTYGRTIKWVEPSSRDTKGNANLTVNLLKPAGITEIVLVTHASHMPRALRAFKQAAGADIRITPAPMGSLTATDRPELDWLPTLEGITSVRNVLRELGGIAAGAY